MKGKFFPFSNVSFCLIKLQIKLSTSNLAAFCQQPGSFQPATWQLSTSNLAAFNQQPMDFIENFQIRKFFPFWELISKRFRVKHSFKA
jgi:hypothetical protein